MNSNDITNEIVNLIRTLIDDQTQIVGEETPLIGDGSVLDSMKLVELCLALEDQAEVLGFEFDWTSDAAMSNSRSMFKTTRSLIEEFLRQMDCKK